MRPIFRIPPRAGMTGKPRGAPDVTTQACWASCLSPTCGARLRPGGRHHLRRRQPGLRGVAAGWEAHLEAVPCTETGGIRLFPIQFSQERINSGQKTRQGFPCNPPDTAVHNHGIAVNQQVSERHDLRCFRNSQGRHGIEPGELIQGLTNDLEFPLHCGMQQGRACIFRKIDTRNETLNGNGCLSHVPEKSTRITLHRPPRDSARCLRARRGF